MSHNNVAEFLIRSSADVDTFDYSGSYNSLLWAVEKGNSALFQMLFVNNVDLNALDKHSQTRVADFLMHKETSPKEGSDESGCQKVEGIIMEAPIHWAVSNKKNGLAKLLIARDKCGVDKYGKSALHYAVSEGYEDLATMLLDHSVDLILKEVRKMLLF